MTDDSVPDPVQQVEKELARIQREIDEQLKIVHRLEAQGRDDSAEQQKLETLLEALETAQQRIRAARRGG